MIVSGVTYYFRVVFTSYVIRHYGRSHEIIKNSVSLNIARSYTSLRRMNLFYHYYRLFDQLQSSLNSFKNMII